MRTQAQREWIATVLLHVLVLLLVYLVYRVLTPFLVPLAWATVLVIFCYPWHARLPRRWNPSFRATVSTLLLTGVVIVPTLLIASAFIAEASHALDAVSQAFARARVASPLGILDRLQRFVPAGLVVDVKALTGRAVGDGGVWLASGIGSVLEGAAVFIFDLVVTMFAAFFFFRDAEGIMRRMRNALPLENDLRERLLTRIRDVVRAAIVSSFIVAATQGLLGGLAFWLLDISAPVFWGVAMALFCLIPLGAWVVWLPAAVWLIATGSPGRGVMLIGIGAGIVSGVDNFLRPLLMSGRTGMNPLLMFISLLGGVAAFGLLGLLLGPVVMAVGLALFDAYAETVDRARAGA